MSDHIHSTPDLKGVVIIVGNYGSGKTEVAVNMAVVRQAEGVGVRIADLDLVNPYFRAREARLQLQQLGVDVVIPPEKYLHADLPILSPEVAAMIRQPSPLTILDVGGDHVGANVLAALADAFGDNPPQMLQVVNPYRPFTETVAGCMQIRLEIEEAAKLNMTGIIGNANLIDQTDVGHIYDGHEFVQRFSKESGLPVSFVTADADMLPKLDPARLDCPVLPIRRQLVPPWRRTASLAAS